MACFVHSGAEALAQEILFPILVGPHADVFGCGGVDQDTLLGGAGTQGLEYGVVFF